MESYTFSFRSSFVFPSTSVDLAWVQSLAELSIFYLSFLSFPSFFPSLFHLFLPSLISFSLFPCLPSLFSFSYVSHSFLPPYSLFSLSFLLLMFPFFFCFFFAFLLLFFSLFSLLILLSCFLPFSLLLYFFPS